MASASLETIERSPAFQELVTRRTAFGWTLSALVFILYFGFILLVAFAPGLLGTPIGGSVITLGIPVGLFVIVAAFVLTGLYVRRANSEYDALVRRIVEEAR